MIYLFIIIITVIIISILWFFSWYRLTDQLMEQHSPRHRWMLFIAVSTAIQLGFNLVSRYTVQYWVNFYDYVLMGVFTLQGIVMWWLLYRRAKLAKAISSIALSYFFLYATVYILEQLVMNIVNNQSWQEELGTLTYLIVANLLNILYHSAALFFCILLGRLIEKLRFTSYYSNLFRRPKMSRVVCIISLILMHSQCLLPALFPALDTSTTYLAMSLISGVFALFAILAAAMFETNRVKVKMQEDFIAQQQIYVQTLEGLQQDVRAFQHDYQNLLSGMYLQASQGNTDDLRKTLQSTLHYFDDRLGGQIRQVTELARISVTEVKSLLLVKLARAENLRLKIILEIPAEVARVDMNTADFVRCLGILLDNAMEAATEINDVPIRVALIQNNMDLTLIVTNPFQEKPILHQLGKCGYTTKGAGHGTGLSNYKTLTEQYDNVSAVTDCFDGVFRQELQIRRVA